MDLNDWSAVFRHVLTDAAKDGYVTDCQTAGPWAHTHGAPESLAEVLLEIAGADLDLPPAPQVGKPSKAKI